MLRVSVGDTVLSFSRYFYHVHACTLVIIINRVTPIPVFRRSREGIPRSVTPGVSSESFEEDAEHDLAVGSVSPREVYRCFPKPLLVSCPRGEVSLLKYAVFLSESSINVIPPVNCRK